MFPSCYAAPTKQWNLPLCDRHILKVYRLVAHSMGVGIIGGRTQSPDSGGIPPEYYQPHRDQPDALFAPGLVYYLRLGSRIKIGYTKDLARRLNEVPHEDVLLARPGTRTDEKREHRRWAHLRTTGEWFKAEPELLEYIESLT